MPILGRPKRLVGWRNALVGREVPVSAAAAREVGGACFDVGTAVALHSRRLHARRSRWCDTVPVLDRFDPRRCPWPRWVSVLLAVAACGSRDTGATSSSGSPGIATPRTATCRDCEQTTCASEWSACQANATCVSFMSCEDQCGSLACTCEQQFPGGAATWLALNRCATSNCSPPCPFLGVGDPCENDIDCAGLATCSAWCTESCATSSDCAGMNFEAANLLGENNYCILDGDNTSSCFPGCTTSADCQAFAGTDCAPVTTVDSPRAPVTVCALLPQ